MVSLVVVVSVKTVIFDCQLDVVPVAIMIEAKATAITCASRIFTPPLEGNSDGVRGLRETRQRC